MLIEVMNLGYAQSGAGAAGTAYSGGAAGGASHGNAYYLSLWGGAGVSDGGAGGAGAARKWRYSKTSSRRSR